MYKPDMYKMENALENKSVSALRNLLIEEVKSFIGRLDDAPTAELDARRLRLRTMFDLITEKEENERRPLAWGKNSAQTANSISHFDAESEVIP